MRIQVCQLNPIVGDLDGNRNKVIEKLHLARSQKADIVLFSELVLCGYPPEDLVLRPGFIDSLENHLHQIIEATDGLMVVLGTVRRNLEQWGKPIHNSAAIIIDKKLMGFKDKTLLPTYDVFDERRYFEPGRKEKVWEYKGKKIGVLICEDIWGHEGDVLWTKYERNPVEELQKLQPDILLNLSASPYHFQKQDIRTKVCSEATNSLHCPLFLCNQVGANDNLIFDGYSIYMDEKGKLLHLGKGFAEDCFTIDLEKKYSALSFPDDPYKDLYHALILGVKDYYEKQGFTEAILGLSGGIDSALVACIAVDALGKQNVHCIAMPSRFSSQQSLDDAKALCKNLHIDHFKVISIDTVFQSYLDLLTPHFADKPSDVTEENIQARIRGMILMALSNKFGYIVLSTGNKSEMAMGFSTLYGDMCGGYGALVDVAKTNVYALARWINSKKEIIPQSIIDKPPSAELRLDQMDLDSLPEYGVVDAVLEDYVENHLSIDQIVEKRGFEKAQVKDLVVRIYLAEYKRRQSPPGPRVTKKAFNRGRNFPIVQKWH